MSGAQREEHVGAEKELEASGAPVGSGGCGCDANGLDSMRSTCGERSS